MASAQFEPHGGLAQCYTVPWFIPHPNGTTTVPPSQYCRGAATVPPCWYCYEPAMVTPNVTATVLPPQGTLLMYRYGTVHMIPPRYRHGTAPTVPPRYHPNGTATVPFLRTTLMCRHGSATVPPSCTATVPSSKYRHGTTLMVLLQYRHGTVPTVPPQRYRPNGTASVLSPWYYYGTATVPHPLTATILFQRYRHGTIPMHRHGTVLKVLPRYSPSGTATVTPSWYCHSTATVPPSWYCHGAAVMVLSRYRHAPTWYRQGTAFQSTTTVLLPRYPW